MLGGRDLAGRALDQVGEVLAGESTDLDAMTLGRRVELRPVSESCGRRVEETQQVAWRAVGGPRPQPRRPSRRLSFADPGHSDNRMTLAIYTHPEEGIQLAVTTALEEAFS